ncbi:gamma-glutamyltransferase family protein [Chelatococcus asaccharovorans]|uniref:gamma-glutamyltransferase family protein n=1 Tax=Chelatococcus asaccharovorans TaxID=28210 RepID=UPI00224C6B09|nr:gamma-glutamyltransferase family protein [Chelatococcus asaccharovorans]CAH1652093.1 Oxamate amidohydrolase proenzyme [Chelatococcus asaccharovorans]CAH1686437.1 Oxamate amidohydrolase proenzyme [Chelatococcus asaccharovorans]
MLNTVRSQRGMVTAPHHLASEAGLRVLRDGGNAIEAAIAMAATLAVVYPHMTGIGGDGFWIIAPPGGDPIAIDACGRAALAATPDLYKDAELSLVPTRGPLAANTVAGTVSGWREAQQLSTTLGGGLPLGRILEDAIWYAENGFPVSASQAELTQAKLAELRNAPGFAATFLPDGRLPTTGEFMRLPALAATLRRLAAAGFDDLYRGELGRRLASDLAAIGAPLTQLDLADHHAITAAPLATTLRGGIRLANCPPPTQGVASLMILAIFDRLQVAADAETFGHVHGLVEATKRAFVLRDRLVGDPAIMAETAQDQLQPERLDSLAAAIDMRQAMPWPAEPSGGDTVWLGAIDANGVAVSFIQSIFFEFGSGCVLPETGVLWQNRGSSFSLSDGIRQLGPGRKPFHTLNPAAASFPDGRVMVYGTMGGEGQPQTQAAIFTRYGIYGQDLQSAITAPRWLLGKTWGEDSVTLKVENRFSDSLIADLRGAGHDVALVDAFTSTMGHAGAIVRHANGLLEGASDPRSDGAATGY